MESIIYIHEKVRTCDVSGMPQKKLVPVLPYSYGTYRWPQNAHMYLIWAIRLIPDTSTYLVVPLACCMPGTRYVFHRASGMLHSGHLIYIYLSVNAVPSSYVALRTTCDMLR